MTMKFSMPVRPKADAVKIGAVKVKKDAKMKEDEADDQEKRWTKMAEEKKADGLSQDGLRVNVEDSRHERKEERGLEESDKRREKENELSKLHNCRMIAHSCTGEKPDV